MHTAEFQWMTAWLVFATYVLIDILYAAYILEVGKRRAFRAALLSSVIYGLLAYGILTYSHNTLYLVPLVLGAFSGTYLTVRFNR
jgi:uncharacterized membrane protein